MSRRAAVLLWLGLGAAVWNGVFDLYVSRGAREYLQREAESELGRGPQPAMAQVMSHAKRDGVTAASLWAAVIISAGCVTVFAVRRP
jgi:hypothetical protein